MGLSISSIFTSLSSQLNKEQDVKVLMFGLDSVGKTTILYRILTGKLVSTVPTIAFNKATIRYKNINFTLWDVSGRDEAKALWRSFKLNTSAIIFVIDSSDHLRLTTARTDLLLMLVEEELKLAPLLVFCNKQDIDGAMKPEYICEQLGLAGTEQSKLWHVQGCCASKGEGLMDGLSWLANALRQKY